MGGGGGRPPMGSGVKGAGSHKGGGEGLNDPTPALGTPRAVAISGGIFRGTTHPGDLHRSLLPAQATARRRGCKGDMGSKDWRVRQCWFGFLRGRTVRCARAVRHVGCFPRPVAMGPRVTPDAVLNGSRLLL